MTHSLSSLSRPTTWHGKLAGALSALARVVARPASVTVLSLDGAEVAHRVKRSADQAETAG
jgi:hypothetical protein